MRVIDAALQANEEWAVSTVLSYGWGKPPQAVTGEGGEGPAEYVLKVECDGINFSRRFGISPVSSSSPSTTEPSGSQSA